MDLKSALLGVREKVASGKKPPLIDFVGYGEDAGVLKVNAFFDCHSVVMDEPEEIGGTGSAMDPAQTLLACVAASFLITTKLMAADLDVKTERIRVAISSTLDVRTFLGIPGGAHSGLFGIEVTITLDAAIGRDKLLELESLVTSRCPVWATLSSTARGNVKLLVGQQSTG